MIIIYNNTVILIYTVVIICNNNTYIYIKSNNNSNNSNTNNNSDVNPYNHYITNKYPYTVGHMIGYFSLTKGETMILDSSCCGILADQSPHTSLEQRLPNPCSLMIAGGHTTLYIGDYHSPF